MNEINREIRYEDGTIDTVLISSEDNYSINLNKSYKLANCYASKNKVTRAFKNSIFGTDIGVNSRGFASVTLISTVLAVLTFVILYFSWRI